MGGQGSLQSTWSPAPKCRKPSVHQKTAKSTLFTRLPSTRPAKPLCMPRVSAVTTVSSSVTVARPSLSSTRRLRPQRKLCCVLSVSSASTNLTMAETLQALRACRQGGRCQEGQELSLHMRDWDSFLHIVGGGALSLLSRCCCD